MFVNEQDFEIPDFAIPNLDDENASDGTFDDFCDEQEEGELRDLLGDSLYEQFVLGLADVSPDAKWLVLRDGGSYTYGGKNYLWRGMKHLLKPFIWYAWMRDLEVKKSQVGANLALAENSEKVSLAPELCRKYNEYAYRSGFTLCRRYVSTLYGFLTANVGTYPDWDDQSEIEYINQFGI